MRGDGVVVWRCGDDESDGEESDGRGAVAAGGFEAQLAALRGAEARRVERALGRLEDALFTGPIRPAAATANEDDVHHDGENAGGDLRGGAQVLRDGVSYALTTPASVAEWATAYPYLRVSGSAAPLTADADARLAAERADLLVGEAATDIFALDDATPVPAPTDHLDDKNASREATKALIVRRLLELAGLTS